MSKQEWTPKINSKVAATLRNGTTIEGKVVAIDRRDNGEWFTVQYLDAGVKKQIRMRGTQLRKPEPVSA